MSLDEAGRCATEGSGRCARLGESGRDATPNDASAGWRTHPTGMRAADDVCTRAAVHAICEQRAT